jgi:hypothetical protein
MGTFYDPQGYERARALDAFRPQLRHGAATTDGARARVNPRFDAAMFLDALRRDEIRGDVRAEERSVNVGWLDRCTGRRSPKGQENP